MTDAVPSPRRSLSRALRERSANLWREAVHKTQFALEDLPKRARNRGLQALRLYVSRDTAKGRKLIGRLRRVAPKNPGLARIDAVLQARKEGWAAARAAFADLPQGGVQTALALLRKTAQPALHPALPAPDQSASPKEVVVYTTALGTDPAPNPIFPVPASDNMAEIRYLCFAQMPAPDVPGWQFIALPADAPKDPDQARAWCRVRPDLALAEAAPQAEASIWIAPDWRIVGNLAAFARRWGAHPLVMWRHEQARDWQDLAERHLVEDGSDPEAIITQAEAFEARALPRDLGLVETGMIWRQHTAPEVITAMQGWQAEAEARPGLEAASLYAALAETEANPLHILPRALGAARDNVFVAKLPSAPLPPAPVAPALVGGKIPLTILYAEEFANSASTFLRGFQLSNLLKQHCADQLEITYTSVSEGLRDQVVILTKGAIESLSPEEIRALRQRNVALLASWDDLWPVPKKMAEVTANMTLSHRQTVDFANMFPATPCFHVTHHVNMDIPETTPPQDRLRAGYFGLARNTYRPESLSGLIDLVGLNTSEVGTSWIDRLPEYNCHWTVRQRARARDGWKPFLKGFVAARCHAVVAIGPEDDDAMQYLGDDYPFYIRSHDKNLLEYDMYGMAAAFGGPEWRRAQEIMDGVRARSTDAVVATECLAMVREVCR